MAVFKLNDKCTGPFALMTTGLFLTASVLFFLPIGIPHKVTLPVGLLT